MTSSIRSTALALLAGVSAIASAPTVASAAETFKFGLIASYTGAFATWGPQFQNAIEAFQAVNVKTAYTITSDYAPGHDAETYFHKSFKAAGGEIIGSARTPIQETNFGVYMERALQAKPNAVYMFQPGGSPSIAFVRAFTERGLK